MASSSIHSSGTGGTGSDDSDQIILCQDSVQIQEDQNSSSCGSNERELSHLCLVEDEEDEEEAVQNSGPTNIDLVVNKLYLGNLAAACDISVLEKYRINYILTIDSCPLPSRITHLPHVQNNYIQISDMPREDILRYFDETFQFIEKGVSDENDGAILVHCYFGVSRSATIVLAYLMRKWEISLEEAQERLKARRNVIGPNFGFLSQLKLFEKMKFKIDKRNLFYRRFQLQVASDKIRSVKILPHPYNSEVVKADPSFSTPRPDPIVYQCRKCRRVLASASNLLTHFEKKSPVWFDFTENESDAPICTQIIYVEPIAWMTPVQNNLQGKLYCPNQNCKSKLGSFSWIRGYFCPCGAKVQPAFYLVPSKVDRSTSVLNLQITL